MKVKSIRGAVKYNGIVYSEGMTFDIDEKDLKNIIENVEIIPEKKPKADEKNTEEIQYTENDKKEAQDIDKDKKTDYKSMSKDELTALALSKGLDPDIGKRKKEEIIEQLEKA